MKQPINLESDLLSYTFKDILRVLRSTERKIQKYSHLYLKAYHSEYTGGSYQLSDRAWTWQRLWDVLYDELAERYNEEYRQANEDAGFTRFYNFGDLIA